MNGKTTLVDLDKRKVTVEWKLLYTGVGETSGYTVFTDKTEILYIVEGPKPFSNNLTLFDIIRNRYAFNPNSLTDDECNVLKLLKYGINVTRKKTF